MRTGLLRVCKTPVAVLDWTTPAPVVDKFLDGKAPETAPTPKIYAFFFVFTAAFFRLM
jgi:hypothetical protein